MIKEFRAGTIQDLSEGSTLRAYLAEQLGCSPKRISKKLECTEYNGRQNYKKRSSNFTAEELEDRAAGLESLKERFLASLEELRIVSFSSKGKTKQKRKTLANRVASRTSESSVNAATITSASASVPPNGSRGRLRAALNKTAPAKAATPTTTPTASRSATGAIGDLSNVAGFPALGTSTPSTLPTAFYGFGGGSQAALQEQMFMANRLASCGYSSLPGAAPAAFGMNPSLGPLYNTNAAAASNHTFSYHDALRSSTAASTSSLGSAAPTEASSIRAILNQQRFPTQSPQEFVSALELHRQHKQGQQQLWLQQQLQLQNPPQGMFPPTASTGVETAAAARLKDKSSRKRATDALVQERGTKKPDPDGHHSKRPRT